MGLRTLFSWYGLVFAFFAAALAISVVRWPKYVRGQPVVYGIHCAGLALFMMSALVPNPRTRSLMSNLGFVLVLAAMWFRAPRVRNGATDASDDN